MTLSTQFKIILQILPGQFAVCKLPPHAPLPLWLSIEGSPFFSITKTQDELSIVCEQNIVPSDIRAQKNWRMIKVKGQLNFDLIGILTQILNPLADNHISVFCLSTYDTDYVLLQEKEFDKAIAILEKTFLIEK